MCGFGPTGLAGRVHYAYVMNKLKRGFFFGRTQRPWGHCPRYWGPGGCAQLARASGHIGHSHGGLCPGPQSTEGALATFTPGNNLHIKVCSLEHPGICWSPPICQDSKGVYRPSMGTRCYPNDHVVLDMSWVPIICRIIN